MLTIGRLRLQLPPALRDRAEEIARLTAGELANVPFQSDLRIDRLVPPPLAVSPQAGVSEVARGIAGAIRAALEKEAR